MAAYRRCPRQYEFAHIKKLPRGIRPPEAFGAAIHSALKRWGDAELAQKTSVPDTDQIPLFREQAVASPLALSADTLQTLWHGCLATDAYATKAEADFFRYKGERVLAQFFAWWRCAPRDVLAVERGFSIMVGSERYTGRFDRVERTEEGIVIIDYKTSPPRSQESADVDLQLSLYALACPFVFAEPCAALLLVFLGEEGVTEVRTQRTAAQLHEAEQQLQSLRESIARGVWDPTPSVACCSGCPYRTVCDAAAV